MARPCLHHRSTVRKAATSVLLRRGIAKGLDLTYHDNGLVAERKEESNDQYSVTSWYANGQIKQVKKGIEPRGGTLRESEKLIAFWDSAGRQLIKDGTGRIVSSEDVTSRLNTMLRTDAGLRTQLIEQGTYENGLKQGVWTGRYTDKSYFYEEQYDKGICKGGKAIRAGGDTLRYTKIEQQPEFKGGMDALGFFLSKNLHFPDQAIRANVQGKVFLTFTIDTDGAIQDISVLRGLGFGCDEESVRVINQTQGKWIPGIQRGEPIKVRYSMPINFAFR
ncbi:energy transducer TonB [Spirosoma fluminis]